MWSAGETLSADTVLNAFRLPRQARGAAARLAADDVQGSLLGKIFFWMFIVAIVLILFRCGSGGGQAIAARLATPSAPRRRSTRIA